jgi:outer membrane protein OmpA-like peptidoglycan-associated protein
MTRLARILAPLAAALLLTSCAGMKLQEAEKVTPSGDAFQTGLYKGYLDLSGSEFREADYEDSDVFASRAINAGSGQTFGPEEIERRALPEDKVGELTSSRGRLVNALAGGAAARKPMEAANAQVMFDCWMQEQEENFQPEDIARCRAGFMDAIAMLEEVPPKKVVEAAPPPKPLPGPYMVFFEFDKAELTDEAKAILAAVATDAGEAKDAKIFTSGHTDRAGANLYNDKLSEMRVEAVRQYLLDSGVGKVSVLTSSYGENQPMVSTEDGTAEPKNRRVEIKFAR